MTDKKEVLESIDHRLKMLLKLEVEDELEDYDTKKEKIRVLHEMGFDKSDMVELVDSTRGSVRTTLNTLNEEDKIDD
jgi:hypothetical protein